MTYIHQLDETDCGAACIAMIASHYKLQKSVTSIREIACTDKRGTNLAGMAQAAKALGFSAHVLKGTPESLTGELPFPFIAHIAVKHNEYTLHHYVVVKKIHDNKIDIWDPDVIKELAGGWEDEEKQEYFRSDKASEFTVEYWKRSWPDAHKYGFLSANMKNTGRYLRNIQVGDIIYCHIAGAGFVGIGECTALAVPMDRFTVMVDNEEKLIGDVPWVREDLKDTLIPNEELFIRVDWKRAVDDEKDGYWVKGMKSLPMVAYQNSDRTTHDMVQKYFESL